MPRVHAGHGSASTRSGLESAPEHRNDGKRRCPAHRSWRLRHEKGVSGSTTERAQTYPKDACTQT
eukprot:1753898-Rhodomonas_salina.1